MIVIWAGDAIFAMFCRNAQNGLIKYFEYVQNLKKWNFKIGARPKLGARVLGPAQRANLGYGPMPGPIYKQMSTMRVDNIWYQYDPWGVLLFKGVRLIMGLQYAFALQYGRTLTTPICLIGSETVFRFRDFDNIHHNFVFSPNSFQL